MKLRSPKLDDIPALVAIEAECFDYYQLKASSFRHFITKGHCDLMIAEHEESTEGYALVLYRKSSRCARLYSIAILEKARKLKLGTTLMDEMEKKAKKRGCTSVMLEVRAENMGAIRFYERLGYRQYTILKRYYKDGGDALRLKKSLIS
jgi:ribosomal-protein-alanine acetyltransferase